MFASEDGGTVKFNPDVAMLTTRSSVGEEPLRFECHPLTALALIEREFLMNPIALWLVGIYLSQESGKPTMSDPLGQNAASIPAVHIALRRFKSRDSVYQLEHERQHQVCLSTEAVMIKIRAAVTRGMVEGVAK